MTTSNDPDEIRADIERTRATLSGDVDELAESVKPQNVAGRQMDKIKDAVGSVKERVMGSDEDDYSGSAVDTVSDEAGSARNAMTDNAYAAKDAVGQKAYEAREAVSQAPTTVKRKAQGNPLAAGVIAFGLGMLVSSLIPSTEKEREAVSQLQDSLGPLKDKASEVAGDVAGNLRQPAQEAAASVKTTATEGAQNVQQEGQSAAQDVKDQAVDSKETVRQQATS
jgi:hypothetical protein